MKMRIVFCFMLVQCKGLFGQQFITMDTLQLSNLGRPVFEWVDVDNDGLLDVFITGQDLSITDSSRSLSFIYHQQPDTTFLLVETDLETYGDQLFRLADLNMDGRQDLVVTTTDGLRLEQPYMKTRAILPGIRFWLMQGHLSGWSCD